MAKRSLNFTDAVEKYLRDNNIEKQHPGGITSWVMEYLSDVVSGRLIRPEELDKKNLSELQKEKLQTEIELNRLKKEAMEAKTIIDQAGALKVELIKEGLEHKRLKNEELRRKLNMESKEKAEPAKTGTLLQIKTWQCTNGCNTELRWPSKDESQKNKSNRPIETETGIMHYCPNYHRDRTPAVVSAMTKSWKPTYCGDCGKHFDDQGKLRDHAMQVHKRHLTAREEQSP